jgi:hypothetical protein
MFQSAKNTVHYDQNLELKFKLLCIAADTGVNTGLQISGFTVLVKYFQTQ